MHLFCEFRKPHLIIHWSMLANRAYYTMSFMYGLYQYTMDCDIKVNIHTILKHACRTRTGPQRCCHSTNHIWQAWNIKNRRHFWFSEQIGNTRGRTRKSLQANLKMSSFYWNKNCSPENNSETVLHGHFKNQSRKWLKNSANATFAVVFNGKVCPQASKISDLYKIMRPERLHPNVPKEPVTINARTVPITFERLQS